MTSDLCGENLVTAEIKRIAYNGYNQHHGIFTCCDISKEKQDIKITQKKHDNIRVENTYKNFNINTHV